MPGTGADAGLQQTLAFAPTLRRQTLLLAMLAAAFGLLMVASAAAALETWHWALQALVLLSVAAPAAWLTWLLARQALSDQPVVRLDADGIQGAGLRAPVPWEALDDVELERPHGGALLRLTLKPDPSRPDKRRFLDGRNPARPQISLHMLTPQQQDEAFYAIHARLGVLRTRAGVGEAAGLRETRAHEAFEDRLDLLTPRVWALYAMVAVNVLVWCMHVAAGISPTAPLSPQLFAWGANSASAVVLDGELWRLLTATFLHGGIMHLAFNMLGLWEAGKQLCRLLGNGQFLLIYLASALCGSAAGLHLSTQLAVSVGASGAVFGVLGGLLAASWHYRRQVPAHNSRRLWSGLGVFVVYSLLNGLRQEGVDNAAHFGGLACGVLLGLLLLAPFDAAAWRARRLGRAAIGACAVAVAITYAVMATPIPGAWHRQVFEAQATMPAVSKRFELMFQRLAVDHRSLQRGELSRLQFFQRAERSLVPGCRELLTQLAPLRVPRWEPLGQAVFLYQRICVTSAESAALELARARADPRLPPDTDQRLARLSADMDQLMRQLANAPRPRTRGTDTDASERKP